MHAPHSHGEPALPMRSPQAAVDLPTPGSRSAGRAVRGAILYVPPLEGARHALSVLAAQQAQGLRAMGHAVRACALSGCDGDGGDLTHARWQAWRGDVARAAATLRAEAGAPLHLWGVGLGGLLALDCAAQVRPARLILWQPSTLGSSCINALVRRHLAAQPVSPHGSLPWRARLEAEGPLSLGPYTLPAALVQAIDACDAATLALPPCTVHWLAHPGPAPSRSAARAAHLAALWAAQGVTTVHHPLPAGPNAAGEAPHPGAALLAATGALFGMHAAGTPD